MERVRWPELALALAACAPAAAAQAPCAWNRAADAPQAVFEAPAVRFDGRMLVFGGFLAGLKASTAANAYDPAADAWSALASLPAPVTHAGVARDGRTVWFAGGFVGDHPGPVTDDVWSYDIELDAWQARPDLPAPRGSGGLFVIGRELHFAGGVDVDRDTDRPEHWVLDLDHPLAWVASAPLPVPRNHFATASAGGRGYVLGGQFHHDTSPQDVAYAHAWDPLLGWIGIAALPFPRSHCEPSVDVVAGRIVIAGGRSNVLGWLSLPDVLAYDTQADAWSLVGLLPDTRIATALKILDGEFVQSGGGVVDVLPKVDAARRAASTEPLGVLRLDAGGDGFALGQTWCAGAFDYGGKDSQNPAVTQIAGTELDALYLSARTGSDADPAYAGCRLPAADGPWLLRLHFAEIHWGAPGGGPGGPGKRVFDVSAEGVLLLDDLDLSAAVGPVTALATSAVVDVSGGMLELDLVASVDRPLLSGVELLALDPAGAYCVGAPNSAGHGARMARAGGLSIAEDELVLVAQGCPPHAVGLFLESPSPAQVPLFAGFLCVGAPFERLLPAAPTDSAGNAVHVRSLLDAHVAAGATRHYQYWYRDTALATSNFSDGLALTFVP